MKTRPAPFFTGRAWRWLGFAAAALCVAAFAAHPEREARAPTLSPWSLIP